MTSLAILSSKTNTAHRGLKVEAYGPGEGDVVALSYTDSEDLGRPTWPAKPQAALVAAKDQLREAVLALCPRTPEWDELPPAEREARIHNLWVAGRTLSSALFDRATDEVEFYDRIGAFLPGAHIQVATAGTDISVPWELLRGPSHDAPFLGHQAVLFTADFAPLEEGQNHQRIEAGGGNDPADPLAEAFDRAFEQGAADPSALRIVKYAEDCTLHSARRHVRPPTAPLSAVEEITTLSPIVKWDDVQVLDDLHLKDRRRSERALKAWTGSRGHVWHFNGHGDADAKAVQVRQHYPFGLGHFDKIGANMLGSLVFLNACDTYFDVYTPEQTIAAHVHGLGATCVICTHGQVDDAFATQFSAAIYQELAQGSSIGEALLQSRITLHGVGERPLGLLYTLVGRPIHDLT